MKQSDIKDSLSKLNYENINQLMVFFIKNNAKISEILKINNDNVLKYWVIVSDADEKFNKDEKIIYVKRDDLISWRKLCKKTLKNLWDLISECDYEHELGKPKYFDYCIDLINDYTYDPNLCDDGGVLEIKEVYKLETFTLSTNDNSNSVKATDSVEQEQNCPHQNDNYVNNEVLEKLTINTSDLEPQGHKVMFSELTNRSTIEKYSRKRHPIYYQIINQKFPIDDDWKEMLRDTLNYLRANYNDFDKKLSQINKSWIKITANNDSEYKPIENSTYSINFHGSAADMVSIIKILLQTFEIDNNPNVFYILKVN